MGYYYLSQLSNSWNIIMYSDFSKSKDGKTIPVWAFLEALESFKDFL